MKFNPKKIKRTLDYLPRWAWYLASFVTAGPVGALGVYLTFHALEKMIQDIEQDIDGKSSTSSRHTTSTYQDAECTVTGDEEIDRRQQKAQASSEPIKEHADVHHVISSGKDALDKIRHANDLIPDPLLSAQIDSIETSCRQILLILEQRPELLPQLRTFLRYYLPTTLRLLDARARLESTAHTPKAREVRQRISDALGVIDKAFLKQVEALDEYRFLDLESEMDALRDMMRADGLIDEEEHREAPSSATLKSSR